MNKGGVQNRTIDHRRHCLYFHNYHRNYTILPIGNCIQTGRRRSILLALSHNPTHFIKLIFHLLYQSELCTGTNQVVLRICRLEIRISLQKIHQEPDSAFECHQSCTPRKTLQLLRCQNISCHLQIPFHIQLIQIDIKMDLSLIHI